MPHQPLSDAGDVDDEVLLLCLHISFVRAMFNERRRSSLAVMEGLDRR